MGFPDGSTYTMNSKALTLVSEEENATSEHRHAQKRAKAQASSKENKKRAAPDGANTNSSTNKAAKKKTGAPACQVRRVRGIPPVRGSRAQAASQHRAIRTGGIVTGGTGGNFGVQGGLHK